MKQGVIDDFSDESIHLIVESLIDKKTRKILFEKVMEYKGIFEELARLGQYYFPDISSFPTSM